MRLSLVVGILVVSQVLCDLDSVEVRTLEEEERLPDGVRPVNGPLFRGANDLPEKQPSGKQPDPFPMPQIAGPKYGLPGYSATKTGFKGEKGIKNYKNWETGLDTNIFSPAVFDSEYWAKSRRLLPTTLAETKLNWKKSLAENKPNNCHQGNARVSLNKYWNLQEEAVKKKLITCLDVLNYYLSTGIFEDSSDGRAYCTMPAPVVYIPGEDPKIRARKIYDYNAAKAGGDMTQLITLAKDQRLGDLDDLKCLITPTFFMTYWIRWAYPGTSPRFRSILRVGDPDKAYPKSPGIYQYPSTPTDRSTRTKVVMSTDHDPDWGCSPTFQPGSSTWGYMAVVLRKGLKNVNGYNFKLQVYANTKLGCEITTNSTVIIPPKSEQIVSGGDSEHEVAEAKLYQLAFYSYSERPEDGNYTQILEDLIKVSPPKYADSKVRGNYTRKYIRNENFWAGFPKSPFRPRMENIHYPMDHLLPLSEKVRNRRIFRKYVPPVQVRGGKLVRVQPGPDPGVGQKGAPPQTNLMDTGDVTSLSPDDVTDDVEDETAEN